MQHDAAQDMSYSQVGPEQLYPAISVFVLEVMSHNQSKGEDQVPSLLLIHLDSGGGGMPQELYSNQIAWFNRTIVEKRQRFGKLIPALVFVHIPLWEFSDALKGDDHCFGDSDDGINPTNSNTGLFAAIDAAPEVEAVFVGHDHCNDWCCQFGKRSIDLCFGRHSGWGGYDCEDPPGSKINFSKGSRIITFQQQGAQRHSITTHVRLFNGSVTHSGSLT